MSDRANVLIAVPNNNPKHVLYLPTIWGNLKSFCEQSPTAADRYNWLEPVIFKGTPPDLLRPYADTAIDVLGLSCYSWNTNTNLALAAEVRARNPECLVIAGGPHLDYRYSDFFVDHPYVDAVVLRDGEVPFRLALEQRASGALDLASIPGLVLPAGEDDRRAGRRHVLTGPAVLPTDFSRSPWLENAEYFEDLMARLRREQKTRPIGIPWEIDRGCPYTCSFCDWGSNTNSKVRNFPLERVRAEAEWIARNKIHVNFITIANFGSMPRDEEILQYSHRGKAPPRLPAHLHLEQRQEQRPPGRGDERESLRQRHRGLSHPVGAEPGRRGAGGDGAAADRQASSDRGGAARVEAGDSVRRPADLRRPRGYTRAVRAHADRSDGTGRARRIHRLPVRRAGQCSGGRSRIPQEVGRPHGDPPRRRQSPRSEAGHLRLLDHHRRHRQPRRARVRGHVQSGAG